MRIALLPELDPEKRDEVKRWVTAVLAHPELTVMDPYFPLDNQVAIYIEGQLKILRRNEYWMNSGGVLYIGYNATRARQPESMQPIERLAIVGAIISLADLWSDFHETYTARAAAILIAGYQGVMSGLVQTEAAVSGLAFSADWATIAARIGDCYHLPSGESVVIDDTWTLVPDRPNVRQATAG